MSTLLHNLIISLCHRKEWKFVLAVSTSLPVVPCCPGLRKYFCSQRSHCLYFTAYHLRSSIPLDKLRQASGRVKDCMHPNDQVLYHKIIEGFGLEEAFKDHLSQPLCNGQGHLSVYQVVATSNLTLSISEFAHLHCRDWWWSPSYQCIPSLLHIHSNPLLKLLLTLVYLIIHRERTNVGRECTAEVKQGSSFHMSCCQQASASTNPLNLDLILIAEVCQI